MFGNRSTFGPSPRGGGGTYHPSTTSWYITKNSQQFLLNSIFKLNVYNIFAEKVNDCDKETKEEEDDNNNNEGKTQQERARGRRARLSRTQAMVFTFQVCLLPGRQQLNIFFCSIWKTAVVNCLSYSKSWPNIQQKTQETPATNKA